MYSCLYLHVLNRKKEKEHTVRHIRNKSHKHIETNAEVVTPP